MIHLTRVVRNLERRRKRISSLLVRLETLKPGRRRSNTFSEIERECNLYKSEVRLILDMTGLGVSDWGD